MPGRGRRGLRLRCGPRFLRRATSPAALQRLLHPAVAQLDAFGFPQLFMEVPHVEVRILVAVQSQHALGGRHRDSMNAALTPALIEQPVVAVVLVGLSLALHVAHAHPGDLGCLNPRQLLRHRFQNYVLKFHHPLRFSGGHHLARFHLARFTRPAWTGQLAN